MPESRSLDPVRLWVIGLLIASVSVLSYGVALLNQNIDQTKRVGQSNNQFLGNFSDYMHCLVVVDEPAYEKLGKAAYFAECDKLLFRGTGQTAPDRTPVPTTSPPEGTTTSNSAIIGG